MWPDRLPRLPWANYGRHLDWPLLLLVACLLSVGLVMMGSAAVDRSSLLHQSGFHFVMRQSLHLLAALLAGFVVFLLPLRLWFRYGWLALLLGFVLLILVLIPGIGIEVNGSRRWIPLGVVNLQCSEVAKFCLIVYLAGYLVRREAEVREKLIGFIKPIGIMVLLVGLLILEPDFGSVVVLMGVCMGMLFLGGVKLLQFLLVVGLAGLAGAGLIVSSEYRLQRLLTYLDPWADQYGSGYQLVQALIAFGRGEWLGLGLGNSVQKQFYLPEAHTDFVFAILAEELGLVGALAVLALFAALLVRLLWIGRRAERNSRRFAAYLCYGTVILIAAQVFINIGVNTGLLPTKGLTLPFLSYGGSSLMVMGAFMGLMLRVQYENCTVQVPELQRPPRVTRRAPRPGREVRA